MKAKNYIYLLLIGLLLTGCLCSRRRPVNQPVRTTRPARTIQPARPTTTQPARPIQQTTRSQSAEFWTQDELNSATTTRGIDYMSNQEKEVLLLCNLVRLYPKKFACVYLSSADYSINGDNSYVVSLLNDLNNCRPHNVLYPCLELYKAAESHALDMGKHGMEGHNSSNGTTCPNRVKSFYPRFAGECCEYGSSAPIMIVLDLLIDYGITSLGHRKMILETKADVIGIAIRDHLTYSTNTVMDFGYRGE